MFRSSSTRITVLACFMMFATLTTGAQTTGATLTGTVEDQQGATVPGVKITVNDPATGLERTVTTNDSGSFVVPFLPSAKYEVTAERQGFATVKIPDLTLNVNDVRSLLIKLQVGSVGAEVTVTPEASLVNTSPAVATTIDRAFVNNLPLNGRSFQSLILLAPGVVPTAGGNGEFSVNGQRSNANYFTVDGVSGNAGVDITGNSTNQAQAGTVPAATALGTTQNLVNVDALEEFKIQTSTYAAELGRQPGGQVQLVTRSGSNDFHGSAFEYFRNDAFDANDWFNNAYGIEKAPLRQNMFGGTFSGPMFLPRFGEGGPHWYNGKDRTFFFFSYEGLRLRLPSTINTLVPSLELRRDADPAIRPLLNAFSLPTGPGEDDGVARFTSATSDTSKSDSTGLRIDHKINKNLNIFGRYSQTPSESVTRGPGKLDGARYDSRTFTIGANAVVTNAVANEFRFNYSRTRGRAGTVLDNFGGAVPIDISQLVTGYTGSRVAGHMIFQVGGSFEALNVGDSVDSFNRQFNVVDNVSWVKGQHNFKFGVDYRRLAPIYGPVPYETYITFGSADEIRHGMVTSVEIDSKQEVHPLFDNFSAYSQDTWKVTPSLTLDLGLRWELNPPPRDARGLKPLLVAGIDNLATATLAPAGTPLYKTDYKAFAPRVGAAYQLFRRPGGETVLRGGFGVYYDLGNGMSTFGFNGFPFVATNYFQDTMPFPLTPAEAARPSFTIPTSLPITDDVFAINPNLTLPYTLEWNFAVEQSLGSKQKVSISYVASAARELLVTDSTNNSRPGGLGRVNSNFSSITYTHNGPTADYESMQAQYQRRLSRGLQALVNYTWAHAIDEISSEASPGVLERGNSSFDVRHNFSAAVTYDMPTIHSGPVLTRLLRGWSLDTIVLAQTGQPLEILSSFSSQVLPDGRLYFTRPDYVQGQPFWIKDPTAPGGERLNPAAFKPVPGFSTTRQGSLARNAVHAPGIFQINMGLSRKFKLSERLNLQLRAEAFNVLNHPMFTGHYNRVTASSATSPYFGRAQSTYANGVFTGLSPLYQIGGNRSMQFTARVTF